MTSRVLSVKVAFKLTKYMFDLCVYLFAWSGEGVVHIELWAAGYLRKSRPMKSLKSETGHFWKVKKEFSFLLLDNFVCRP